MADNRRGKREVMSDEEIDEHITKGCALREDKNLLEALAKFEQVKGMLSSQQYDLKLDVLSCLQGTSKEIYDDLKEQENNDTTEDAQRTRVQAEKRFPYAERATRYADDYIQMQDFNLIHEEGQDQEVLEEDAQGMIDSCAKEFIKIRLDLKDYTMDEQLRKYEILLKNCHEKNFKYFFLINYQHAKLLYKKAASMDTSTFANVNKALGVLEVAKKQFKRAEDCTTKAAQKYGYGHGKDDKVINLKEAMEQKEYSYKSQQSILNAEYIIEDIMEREEYKEISEIQQDEDVVVELQDAVD